jgi:hypothetical protein
MSNFSFPALLLLTIVNNDMLSFREDLMPEIDLLPVFSVADDYEFDEVDSSIDESPANTATCDQQVNQAASAAA